MRWGVVVGWSALFASAAACGRSELSLGPARTADVAAPGAGGALGVGAGGSGGAGGDDAGACAPSPCDGGCALDGADPTYNVAGDAKYAYWTHEWMPGVKRIPLCGGPVETLSTLGSDPFALAVDATHVYWGDLENQVYRVSLGGGDSVLLSTLGGQPQALALDATDVYVTTVMGNDSGLFRISKSTLGATKLESGTMTLGLAVDATSIYYGTSDGKLMRRSKATGPASPIAQVLVAGMLVERGDRLYFSTWEANGQVISIGKDGSGMTTLDMSPGPIRGPAADATHVYWTDQNGGTVRRTPAMGGPSVTLATSQTTPTGLALNTQWVVWVDYAGTTLMRAPH